MQQQQQQHEGAKEAEEEKQTKPTASKLNVSAADKDQTAHSRSEAAHSPHHHSNVPPPPPPAFAHVDELEGFQLHSSGALPDMSQTQQSHTIHQTHTKLASLQALDAG